MSADDRRYAEALTQLRRLLDTRLDIDEDSRRELLERVKRLVDRALKSPCF